MSIEIPDDLNRRLTKVAHIMGQDVGALVCEAIEQRLAIEERKAQLRDSSDWKCFADRDPFVALIGSFEDDASDVSQDKYGYLADTYDRR